jgi:thiol:disulfide interchange protein DsbA
MILRKTGLTVIFGLAFMLAACGKHSATDQSTAGTATPATSTGSAQSGPAATAARPKPGESAATEVSTITRINEDGSESVEDTSTDNSTRNPILAAVASTFSASASAGTSLVAPSPWQEGVNYMRLVPAQPTSAPAGQVEVLEFFWYACPHCYAIDPLVEAWKKTKPSYITFSREHVMWTDGHRSLARLFYTLESMGKIDELHSAIFKEIHVNQNPLIDLANDDRKSEEIQTAFVVKHGVSEVDFKKAYRSFGVENAMRRADELWQRYRISGVPTFIINGKYVADVGTAKGEEQLLALISDLAAIEHKR